MSWRLRITVRCLDEDLGLDENKVNAPLSEIDDPVVQAFDGQRSQSPIGLEKVQPLTSKVEVYSLHAGRMRGATWHDEAEDVVWLLASAIHRSGARDDAYPYFKKLDADGHLLPDREDYELLFASESRNFATSLIDEVPQLIAEARAQPGSEVRGILADRVRIRLVYEEEQNVAALWVAISMKLIPGEVEMDETWASVALASLFPEVRNPLEELAAGDEWPTGARSPDEVVFAWVHETRT